MLAKDSVKTRLEKTYDGDEGISFTEFSYQIFQGHDFLQLFQKYGCQLQIGGSDQWGNISAGMEHVRRLTNGEAQVHGATIPLLTDSQGNKLGKSVAGQNLWLDKEKTTPYDFYQFLLNTADNDVGDLLTRLTFLELEEINEIMSKH